MGVTGDICFLHLVDSIYALKKYDEKGQLTSIYLQNINTSINSLNTNLNDLIVIDQQDWTKLATRLLQCRDQWVTLTMDDDDVKKIVWNMPEINIKLSFMRKNDDDDVFIYLGQLHSFFTEPYIKINNIHFLTFLTKINQLFNDILS